MHNDFLDHGKRVRESDLAQAEQIAGVCRQFLSLKTAGLSIRQAAEKLKAPIAWFSGENCFLARFQRHGLEGLLPNQRDGAALRFDIPDWFISAARFFYLLSNYRRDGGSVPEAVRRVISLPGVPYGWTDRHKERLAKAIKLPALPECPPALRETILDREKSGRPLVPRRVAQSIAVNQGAVQLHRSPRAFALDNLSAPGSQRRYFNASAGERQIMQPGDWFGGDDATPGIAVCVPCNEVLTPCSTKFGVLVGRFQWLVFHDCRTDKILAWDYVVRPRGSYRAEDVLNGMGAVTKTHGIPRIGWQFEGGIFDAKLVRQSIVLLKCEHWRTYSPHQKSIESVFNRVWTRLAVQCPQADMGRYRNENESNCRIFD